MRIPSARHTSAYNRASASAMAADVLRCAMTRAPARQAARARARSVRVVACRRCLASSAPKSTQKTVVLTSFARSGVFARGASNEESTVGASDEVEALSTSEEAAESVTMPVAMALLDFYKREVSPLLPKSCRYVPTCSEYARQAYKKYGTSKGFVLTAWRLMRCNPLGGKGYDPPMWPPPYLGSPPAEQ